MGDERAQANGASGKNETSNVFVPLTEVRTSPRLDFAKIRERLARSSGREYWRGLEELSDAPEFQDYLQREFPHQAPRDMAPLPRREFFRLMGATLALAGVGGCAYQPQEHIIPYVQQPDKLVPGKALYFNTAYPRGAYGIGVMAESREGRPVKLEGNPDHPGSLGATDVHTQASLLQLYDPDRSQSVRHLGDNTTWESFLGMIEQELPKHRVNGGASFRLVMEPTTSPTLISQLGALLKAFPAAKICFYDPTSGSAAEGTRLAFGSEQHPVYHFDQANRILSLDSNFLQDEPGSVRYARNYVDGRRVRKGRTEMNRLYVVEATPTITGANAEHRVNVPHTGVEAVARAVAQALGVAGATGGTLPKGVDQHWIDAVVKDLRSAGNRALVIAGPQQPPAVHALAHAMNGALGAAGSTVTYTAPLTAHFPSQEQTIAQLADDIKSGAARLVVFADANPAYTTPVDLNFAGVMLDATRKSPSPLFIHLGLYDDETSVLCHWHVPESHYLEAWSDIRAYDGTVSIVQPLIRPLYTSRSTHELVAVLLGESDPQGYDLIRGHWAAQMPAASFEHDWHNILLKGVVPNTAIPAATGVAVSGNMGALPAATAGGGTELILRLDPHIQDGRWANSGWLQELPKPLTSLTWDNAALVSPKMAEELSLHPGDTVELTYKGKTLLVPAWIMVGHPEDAVTLYLGYGRTHAGKVGNKTGFNAYALQTSDAPWGGPGLQVRKTGDRYLLASTQLHFSLEGRDLLRVANVEEFVKNPESPKYLWGGPEGEEGEGEGHAEAHAAENGRGETSPENEPEGAIPGGSPSIYTQEWPSDRKDRGVGGPANNGPGTWVTEGGPNGNEIPQWGMVIDLNACIGCNTCTIACQAENNIATVGKDQVDRHRMMHWIRVDVFYGKDHEHEAILERPGVAFQPVPCMHCEKAPCEPVCPVEATSHSAEGINEMTYNRCVGTRYCQNNCPYKVRRFNFLQYSDHQTPVIQMLHNPDVTVRSRGVMEKCTYCIQRINEARWQAEKEERAIKDGEVVVACQQACPTQAIAFGDVNDTRSNNGKGSLVRQLKEEPLNFGILTELNTRPRTTYMARLRNPNSELGTAESGK